ncbi:SUMF1/EgtB/PvdO family nonheme iron enzyme [Balneolaceae bacterium ANBcel3]|nr:SUMF1/EgtB/PvdO family nonheme iron enzyme [Balneolaceae bacterium ANBcel3]
MNCKICKTELQSNVKFCPECGTKVVPLCTCGNQLSGNEKFCSKCGNPTGKPSSVPHPISSSSQAKLLDAGVREVAEMDGEEHYEKEPDQSHLYGEMVFVQGGRFHRGNEAIRNAMPVHEVELDDFYIGKYPVTQAQWKAVMGTNPCHFYGDDRPVEKVNWEDAQQFIRKLSILTGKSFRLPTEAEWEYAARGGQMSQGYIYSGSDNLDDVGWFEDNSGAETHPVGQKKPNELGIYDMSGNVYEWCNDWYHSEYYKKSSPRNPQGPSKGDFRLFRGGSWRIGSDYCRCAYRASSFPGYWFSYVGFRLVCSTI